MRNKELQEYLARIDLWDVDRGNIYVVLKSDWMWAEGTTEGSIFDSLYEATKSIIGAQKK